MPRVPIAYVTFLAFACVLAFTTPAFAQGVFSEVPDEESTAESASPGGEALARIKAAKTTKSVTVVRVDGAKLRSNDETLEFNVRPGVTLDAKRETVEQTEGGRFVWTGEIPPSADELESAGGSLPPGAATIVVNGADATGTIQSPDGKLFKLQPLGDGTNALIEVNRSALPPEHPPGGVKVQPKSRSDLAPPADLESTDTADRRPVIDLVVAYTKNAKAAAGDIRSLIDLAVAETNKSFTNSKIEASMRVVHTLEYDYADSDKGMETILDEFAKPGDGQLDTIHALRDTHGGDVAVLIVEQSEYCGIARDIGAVAKTAYAIVFRECATGYYSFGHEIGHLAGARHNPANDPTATPYAYGHGFRYADPKQPEKGWRTVMGYACDDGSCQPRIQWWSNPNLKRGGVAMGTTRKQNNARVWNERAKVMAAFKPKVRRDEAPAVADRPEAAPTPATADAPK